MSGAVFFHSSFRTPHDSLSPILKNHRKFRINYARSAHRNSSLLTPNSYLLKSSAPADNAISNF